MEILLLNWELVVLAIALAGALALLVKRFLQMPSQKREKIILEFLVEAVHLAEEKFGSKTGRVKLAYVYQKFVEKHKVLGILIPKKVFDELVDKALKEVEKTLSNRLGGK